MAAKLTHGQYWKMHKMQQMCFVYQATTLRTLINSYIKQHCIESYLGRKDHDRMCEYFQELLDLTANNQLTK